MKTLPIVLVAFAASAHGDDFWFSGIQEIETVGEVLAASDILVESYRVDYSGKEGPWTLDVGLGWNRYRIDYQPILFGTTERLDEGTWLANAALTHEWSKQWSGSLSLRGYEGFSDYRSLWTSEFYRQFFGAFPAYRDPDPKGAAVGASTVWTYLRGAGQAELTLEAGRDEIAPGWSFNPALGQPESDRETLDTVSGSLRVEQVLNGWLKSEVVLSARQTSDRQPRFGIRNAWAAAAGPLAFRLSGGYSEEAPAFDAWYGGALVEWRFLPHWSVNAGYRLYEDSGEIETSGFNAQAPPLESSEIHAGVLWDRGDLAISAGVGFLDTDYEALSADNQFFGNLYRDRDWWTFRLAASFNF